MFQLLTREKHVVGTLRKLAKAEYTIRNLKHVIPKEYIIHVY